MGKVIIRGKDAQLLALNIIRAGGSFEDAADATGYSKDYCRQLATKAGVHKPKNWKSTPEEIVAKKAIAIEMRLQGKTFKEIANAIGYKSDTSVVRILKEFGIEKDIHKRAKYAEIRAYKAEGHSHKEVCEKFGISEATSINAARGISPQASYITFMDLSQEEIDRRGRELIDKYQPNYEYAGNYTGWRGKADLKCKVCGGVFTRSYDRIIRQEEIQCPRCEELEKMARRQEREKARNAIIEQNEEKKRQKMLDMVVEQIGFETCGVCGSFYYSKKKRMYCPDCARRKANRKDKRLKRLKDAIVDKSISLESLAQRDGNVCWLCGGIVDWNDIEQRENAKIAGDFYPSIDHVIPLAAGGLHSWDNVRLAHRRCNYLKSDSLDIPQVGAMLPYGGTEVAEAKKIYSHISREFEQLALT